MNRARALSDNVEVLAQERSEDNLNATANSEHPKVKAPGTWHISAPDVAVSRRVALPAWEAAASGILKDVASRYGATITYGVLRDRLFDETGYRTNQVVSYWIAPVLGAIQRDTQAQGLPPLTALVVDATTGKVGGGYITHGHLDGFEDPHARELAAAVDRLACYRTFASDVPADASPQLTSTYEKRRQQKARSTKREVPTLPNCPTCGLRLPAAGNCDYCN